MYKSCSYTLLAFALIAYAHGAEVISVDRSIPQNLNFSFPNEENIRPKASDFKVINYVLMSNELGERWSVVTITNSSSGNRVFEHEHLMALFADGHRASPLPQKLVFKGSETQSITVRFGQHKFPVLTIYSRN